MAERRQFPIGEQDFANIRNSDMMYIDKTCLVYDLACKSGRKFFFRPKQKFRGFWFESGIPTALVETMLRNDYSFENLTHQEVSTLLMSSVDSDGRTIYKTGVNFSTQLRKIDSWIIKD